MAQFDAFSQFELFCQLFPQIVLYLGARFIAVLLSFSQLPHLVCLVWWSYFDFMRASDRLSTHETGISLTRLLTTGCNSSPGHTCSSIAQHRVSEKYFGTPTAILTLFGSPERVRIRGLFCMKKCVFFTHF